MNYTAEQIIESLPDQDAREHLIIGRLDHREQEVLRVEYFFETFAENQRPLDSYLRELQNNGFESRPFTYDDINEAIKICSDFCAHFNQPLEPDVEDYLRRDIPKNMECTLIIIPISIYNY